MADVFHRLAARLPPPRLTSTPSGPKMRYRERLVEQALILKLVRQQSGLKALQLLLDNGLVQEQGAIQRILDEIGEDIAFLCGIKFSGEMTDLHKRYLIEFWSEEFDHSDPLKSTLARAMIPRKKIRAYVSRSYISQNTSKSDAVSHALHKVYSGFVHAASCQTMDLYGGSPPHFHIDGLLGTTRIRDYQYDSWNYFYRGLVSMAYVAKFLDANEDFHIIFNYVRNIENTYYVM